MLPEPRSRRKGIGAEAAQLLMAYAAQCLVRATQAWQARMAPCRAQWQRHRGGAAASGLCGAASASIERTCGVWIVGGGGSERE